MHPKHGAYRFTALGALCAVLSACGDQGADESDNAAQGIGGRAPVVSEFRDQVLRLDQSVQIPVQATDPDRDRLLFQAQGLPAGLSLDAQSGLIQGAPTTVGQFEVQLSVSDGIHTVSAQATWQIVDSDSGVNLSNLSQSGALAHDRGYYQQDGYWPLSVVRLDVQTQIETGPCEVGEYQGCTLNDVLQDTNSRDDFKPRINVSFDSLEYPASQGVANAELKLRGFSTRTAAQKSFSVKLDSKEILWRNERRLQLNKHPFDTSRMRNKLAFDLLSQVPDLSAARTQFVNVWLQDGDQPAQNSGLYTHVERYGKEYLLNRGWDKDSGMYKAEFFNFSNSDKALMALDENGEPQDEDRFESRLEIKRGDQHQALLQMITEVNDSADFQAVFDRYFDEQNVVTWLAANLLLGHQDLGSHNYYLLNPKDSEQFFFLPWDFDGALAPFNELERDRSTDALRERLLWGYSAFQDNIMISRTLQLPNMHQKIVAKADELRQGPLSDQRIASLVEQYRPLVRPQVMSEPDLPHVPRLRELANAPVWEAHVDALKTVVAQNHQTLQRGFHVPLPPYAKRPEQRASELVLWWNPAISVTGEALRYRVEVASDRAFEQVVYQAAGLEPSPSARNRVEHAVSLSRLPRGRYYYRVFAEVERDPARYWQVSKNNGVANALGAREFTVD